MAVVAFKIAVALSLGLLGAILLRARLMNALSERRFLCFAVGAQTLPAFILFVALYIVAGQEPTSDVPGYYLPAARAVLAGQLPYRDFSLSYAPLFPYVGAALISAWNSGKVFAAFDLPMNALTLILWYFASRASFGERAARESAMMFATSGHLTVQALLGTNQAWTAAALAASVFLLIRGRSVASGVAQSLSLAATKFLAAMFWPVICICAQQRLRWACSAALLSGAIYAAFALAGADPFVALRAESALISSGNLPYVLDPLFNSAGLPEQPLVDGLCVIALLGTFAWMHASVSSFVPAERVRLLYAGLALTGLIFMLFSKKSFTGYAVFFMYPLVLVLEGSSARVTFLLLFNVLLVAEPNLWFRLGGYDRPLHVWLREPHRVVPISFMLLDLTLLACYAWAACQCIRHLREAASRIRASAAAPPAAASTARRISIT